MILSSSSWLALSLSRRKNRKNKSDEFFFPARSSRPVFLFRLFFLSRSFFLSAIIPIVFDSFSFAQCARRSFMERLRCAKEEIEEKERLVELRERERGQKKKKKKSRKRRATKVGSRGPGKNNLKKKILLQFFQSKEKTDTSNLLGPLAIFVLQLRRRLLLLLLLLPVGERV